MKHGRKTPHPLVALALAAWAIQLPLLGELDRPGQAKVAVAADGSGTCLIPGATGGAGACAPLRTAAPCAQATDHGSACPDVRRNAPSGTSPCPDAPTCFVCFRLGTSAFSSVAATLPGDPHEAPESPVTGADTPLIRETPPPVPPPRSC